MEYLGVCGNDDTGEQGERGLREASSRQTWSYAWLAEISLGQREVEPRVKASRHLFSVVFDDKYE